MNGLSGSMSGISVRSTEAGSGKCHIWAEISAPRPPTASSRPYEVGAVWYLSSQHRPFPASLMIGCQCHALGILQEDVRGILSASGEARQAVD